MEEVVLQQGPERLTGEKVISLFALTVCSGARFYNVSAEQFRHIRSGLLFPIAYGNIAFDAGTCKRDEGYALCVNARAVSHNGTADSCAYHSDNGPVFFRFAGSPDCDSGLPVDLAGYIPHAGGTGMDDYVFRLQLLDMKGLSRGKTV